MSFVIEAGPPWSIRSMGVLEYQTMVRAPGFIYILLLLTMVEVFIYLFWTIYIFGDDEYGVRQ